MATDQAPFDSISEDSAAVHALLQAGTLLAKPRKSDAIGALPFVVIPDGYKIETTPVSPFPESPGGTVHLHDADSFARYFRDHAGAPSRIYASTPLATRHGAFLAILDDHSGAIDQGASPLRSRAWRAQYGPDFSASWQLWKGSDGKRMGQVDFAQFVENAMPDIVTPDGATLMEIVLNFEVSSAGHFASATRLQDGSARLQWRDDKALAGQVLLPASLGLSMPVYDGRPPQPVSARLRYRLRDDQLSLWYELVRPERVIADAFAELVAYVRQAASIESNTDPLLLGWLP
jgi:hypothetical protein